MPRREIISPAQREALLVIPVDRAALIEHFVLSEPDLRLIRQRRGAQNRLGIAVQLSLLRFPGTALQADETPPRELINFLALQLHVPSSVWDEYAQRDETRREHLLELHLVDSKRFAELLKKTARASAFLAAKANFATELSKTNVTAPAD